MTWKFLAAALTACAILFPAKESLAWFEVCNKKTNGAGMWVTYAYYEPNVSTVYTDTCSSFERLYSPNHFTAWRNTGWWYLTPNQCANVYNAPLTNTRSYVYAEATDGSTLSGQNPFQVVNSAFSYDQFITPVFQGGEPIETVGYGQCAVQPNPYTVNTQEVWQAGYSNFTYSID